MRWGRDAWTNHEVANDLKHCLADWALFLAGASQIDNSLGAADMVYKAAF